MASAYEQLIDASIRHLQDLKRRGTRFVAVSPETLARLKSGPRLSAPPAIATPSPRPGLAPPRSILAPVPAPAPAPPRATLDPAAKAEALRELRERALVCVKCPHLARTRQHVVFGVGDIDARLLFVGEAPGADEDAQGEPFVGAAGQLLTRIIQTMGFTREQVYIANILKCRPDLPPDAPGNRKPTPEEMKDCIPFLHSQIDLIQPRVLVGLGGVAIEGLLGKSGITKLRGHWQTYRGIPLMPTFHPSYLLHTMAPRDKRLVWEDMLQVMEKLELPISEKQRAFFLPRPGQ